VRVRVKVSLVTRDIGNIFSVTEVIFRVLLAEYYAAEAPGFRDRVRLSLVMRHRKKYLPPQK